MYQQDLPIGCTQVTVEGWGGKQGEGGREARRGSEGSREREGGKQGEGGREGRKEREERKRLSKRWENGRERCKKKVLPLGQIAYYGAQNVSNSVLL